MSILPLRYCSFHSHSGEKRKLFGKKSFLVRYYNKIFKRSGLKKFITNLINLGKITFTQGRILDLLYRHARFFDRSCFLSQGTIAAIVGCARETVNRCLKVLEQLQLIRWKGTHTYHSRTKMGHTVETHCWVTRWNDTDPSKEYSSSTGPKAEECRLFALKTGTSHNRVSYSPLPNGRVENTPPNRKTDSDSTNFASRNKSSQFQFQNTPENFPQKNDKGHRYSNINKNLISGTPHSNKCLEKQKMGFFADLEVTKKNSRFTEFDYTSAKRLRKAIIDGQFVFSKSLGSLDSWANEFYQLRKCTTETEINIVLNWYISKIGQKYTPHAFSAVSFRKKFLSIKLMMKHQAEDEVSADRSLNTFEQEFYDSTKLWDWKNKKLNKKDIKTAIITNTDNYKKLSRAMMQTYQDLYGTSQLHDYYLDLMRSSLNSPEEFSKQQVTEVFHTLDNWDKWSGNILKTCFNCNNTESVEKLIMNLVKSASSGVADKSLLAIISSVKVKLSGG